MMRYIRKMFAVGMGVAAIALCAPAQTALAAPAETVPADGVTDPQVKPEEPAALSVLAAVAIGCDSVTLAWEENDQALLYELQQSEDAQNYTTVATLVPGQEMNYMVGNLYTSKTYYFRLVITDVNGVVITSEPLAAKTVLPAPSVTKLETGTPDKVTIQWTEVEGAAFYRVYRSTTKTGGYKSVKTVYGTSYTNKITTGGLYYYKIMPLRYNPDGKKVRGKCSPVKKIAVQLNAPGDIVATQDGKGEVTLNWTPSDASASYRIYRSQSAEGDYVQIAGNVTGRSYKDSGLTAGETYYYRLKAVCGSLASEMSDAVPIRIAVIKINTRTLYLGPGVKAVLEAETEQADTITWKSLDPAIAKVSKSGKVTGVSQGTTRIIVSAGDTAVSVDVTVTDSNLNGIDVSRWQQAIDWKTVKASGIKFAMLRLAYGKSKDIQFENYYKGATEQGIPVGIYCYSLAKNVDEGIEEAEHLLELLDGRELTYPIALDLEDKNQRNNMNTKARTDLILEYKRIIEDAGYRFVVYSNLNWLNNYIDRSRLEKENVDIWIARYRRQSLGYGYDGGGNVRMWQYTSSGLVDGILDAYGRYIKVDLDVCYDGY